jgi:hypothetical protein
LCLEFLEWRDRFDACVDVAPAGATYAEILASMTPDERETTTDIVKHRTEAWFVHNWSRLRIQVLYIRSL